MEIFVAALLLLGFFYLIHSNDKQSKALEERQRLEKEERDKHQENNRELIARTLSEIVKNIASTKIQSHSQLLLLREMIGNQRIFNIFGISETRIQLLEDIERTEKSGEEIQLPAIQLTREDRAALGEVNLGGTVFLGNVSDSYLGVARSWDDVLSKYHSPEALKLLQSLDYVTIQSDLPNWNRNLNKPVTVYAILTEEGKVVLDLARRLQNIRASTQYEEKLRSYINLKSDEFDKLRILLTIIADSLYANSRNNEMEKLNESGAKALPKVEIATYGLAFAKLFEHYANMKMGAIVDTTLFTKELEIVRDFQKRFSH